MFPRRRWALVACGLMLFAPLTARAADAPIIFSATGDVPYGTSEVTEFQDQIDDHNVYSPSDFFVHLGDIFSGTESCDESRYKRVADIMHMLTVPAYVVPGDNETTGCSSPSSGWKLWAKYFMQFENYFCGTPPTERQSARPENFAFVKNGVLFVGINLVGGNNDTKILQDDATWASQQLSAKKASVRIAVFFAQAGPGDNHSTFFNPFVTAATSFGKPILYIHGNDHTWRYDHPFSAKNVLRVCVQRGGSAPPVQVTVTMDNSNTTNAFLFNRDPWKSKTRFNRPPCVNAGPDQSIAGSSTTLNGLAADNWVPNNPPRLTYSWTKVSGPGTASFSNSTSATTSVGFGATGAYVLRLTVSDGALSSSDDVTVTVGTVSNQPPVAANDSYSTSTGTNLVVSAPGVLGNDSDPNGDPLTAVLATGVSHGTLTLNANGSFTYAATSGFTGTDGFTYKASDGKVQSAAASVSITVSGSGGGSSAVVFQEIKSGGSTGVATVATAQALAAVSGNLYLAAIASKPSPTVTGVSGLGLTWTRVRSQCAGRGQSGVEVWMGRGTPTGGTVTATLQSAVTNATILVARYSGADPTSPIRTIVSGNTLGVSGACSGGIDGDTFAFDLATSPPSLAFAVAADRSHAVTPGVGWAKRGEVFQGADAGSMASVTIADMATSSTTTRADGTFDSATDWAVVALEIKPILAAAMLRSSADGAEGAIATPPVSFRAYPNPFRQGTWIAYDLPFDAQVDVTIYNVRGQRVRTLVSERQGAGSRRLYWDGRSDRGTDLGAGVYFLRAQTAGLVRQFKIALLK